MMSKDTAVLLGTGSIGQAIIRRVGAGKHIVLADLKQENADKAAKVLEDAKKFQAADEGKLEKTRKGTINRDWVYKTLEAKEFEIIDEVYEA